MKHVVGPWIVGSYDDGVVFGGDAYAIARVIEPIDRPHAKARADANARLIAAAPELLDMLERAVRRLEIAHANGDSIMREWIVDARAIIAKAKGEVK